MSTTDILDESEFRSFVLLFKIVWRSRSSQAMLNQMNVSSNGSCLGDLHQMRPVVVCFCDESKSIKLVARRRQRGCL